MRKHHFKKRLYVVLFAVLALVAATGTSAGQTIKIGTVAPVGSPWESALIELAGEWAELSDGEIEVKVYAGGVSGNESDLIRKMRIGRLHGAALTQLALGRIVPDILALSTPFLVRDEDELDYLLTELTPTFSEQFVDEGYVTLTFSKAGSVYFFAGQPVTTPEDLAQTKIAVPAGDDGFLEIWRDLGFTAFPIGMPDYAMALQSGMVTSFYSIPTAVASFGWYKYITHMSPLPVAPAIGAILIDRRSWMQIPENLKPELLNVAEKIGKQLGVESMKSEKQAIEALLDEGIRKPSSEEDTEREWAALGRAGVEKAVDTLISRDIYQKITSLLESFRSNR